MDYSDAIAALTKSDPILATLIHKVGACQLYQVQQTGDLFFSLSKAILYQQLSTKSATAIHQRFLKISPDKSFPSAVDTGRTHLNIVHKYYKKDKGSNRG